MASLDLTRTVHMPLSEDGCTIKNSFGVAIATTTDLSTAEALVDLVNLAQPLAEDAENRRYDAEARKAAMFYRARHAASHDPNQPEESPAPCAPAEDAGVTIPLNAAI